MRTGTSWDFVSNREKKKGGREERLEEELYNKPLLRWDVYGRIMMITIIITIITINGVIKKKKSWNLQGCENNNLKLEYTELRLIRFI